MVFDALMEDVLPLFEGGLLLLGVFPLIVVLVLLLLDLLIRLTFLEMQCCSNQMFAWWFVECVIECVVVFECANAISMKTMI